VVKLPFGSVTGKLDPRFAIGVLLPCLVFSVLTCAVLALAHGTRKSGAWWSALGTPTQALSVAAGLCGTLLIAWVLAEQTPALLGLGAGQWAGRLGRFAADAGRAAQLRRFRSLVGRAVEDEQAREDLYYRFPHRGAELRATELGNVFAAVESYARTRYGLDLVLVWPRLYRVLPPQTAASVAAAKAEIELQLVTSALGLVFGVGVSAALCALGAGAVTLSSWLWGCLAIRYLSRRSAIASAIAYGEEIRSALDLHRRDLLVAVQADEALATFDERTQWELLQRLWFTGLDIQVKRAPVGAGAQPEAPAVQSRRPHVPLQVLAVGLGLALNIVLAVLG